VNFKRILSVLFIICFIISIDPIYSMPGDSASSPSGPFFPGDSYSGKLPKPSDYLGFPLGSRPVDHTWMAGYMALVAQMSPRIELFEYGETYEKRKLYYLIISSEKNIANIEMIKTAHEKVSDPRLLKPGENIDRIIGDLPAIFWAGYSIHGNELSSTDAALGVIYQLADGTDETTMNLLDKLVIVLDPLQNPDGRERSLDELWKFSGEVPNYDLQSLEHQGMWPGGRGNHYFIDLNRDMFTLVHPETRGKIKVCLEWKPQVMIDSHEMGSLDSYLFSPGRAPFNPHMPQSIYHWWKVFSEDHASAFDRYGWSYYTRSWNDEWFPGYTSQWGIFSGMVSILYEQAAVDGTIVKLKTGDIRPYSESVHHHIISTLANMSTAAQNRLELLKSYHENRKDAVANKVNSIGQTFIVDPSQNPDRVKNLINTAISQGIEVKRADAGFTATQMKNEYGNKGSKKFPAGTYLIDFSQPLRYLIQTILDYDVRMPNSTLLEERRSIEKGWGSRMYEVSAWSLPLAYGLETYISDNKVNVQTTMVAEMPVNDGSIAVDDPAFGYIIDYKDDAATYLLADAFSEGLKVRTATYPIMVDGHEFSRGSLLFVKKENPDDLFDKLKSYSGKYGADIVGVNTALSTEGPDLGGNDLRLLREPSIAVLAGSGISSSRYGAIWHMLDYEYRMRIASLNIQGLGGIDLKKYNVIIVPHSWYIRSALNKHNLEKLKKWVKDGGTLIAMGSAATFFADSTSGLSQVRLRSQSLEKLGDYDYAVSLEVSADEIKIDSLKIWEGTGSLAKSDSKEDKKEKQSKEDLKRFDDFARKFAPGGAIMNCRIDTTKWLSYGLGESLPVLMDTRSAFMSKPPVNTVARFTGENNLRLSGLLWPEAKTRWANSAYCTQERVGSGQIVLFAGEPNMRSFFYGSKRLFVNAILLGPGMGVRWPAPY